MTLFVGRDIVIGWGWACCRFRLGCDFFPAPVFFLFLPCSFSDFVKFSLLFQIIVCHSVFDVIVYALVGIYKVMCFFGSESIKGQLFFILRNNSPVPILHFRWCCLCLL